MEPGFRLVRGERQEACSFCRPRGWGYALLMELCTEWGEGGRVQGLCAVSREAWVPPGERQPREDPIWPGNWLR